MDDQTLLQDPIVLAALAVLAAQDGRTDALARAETAYTALQAAGMWPANLGQYAGLNDAEKLKLWVAGIPTKSLQKPSDEKIARVKQLYESLYSPQLPPPVQGGFGEQVELVKKAKILALVAQLAALGSAPDALTKCLEAASAMYNANAWTLEQVTKYSLLDAGAKLNLWANGGPFKAAWGMPTAAEQQAAIDAFRALYAQQIADGTVQVPSAVSKGKSGLGSSGGIGVGTIVLGLGGLYLAYKIFGGR